MVATRWPAFIRATAICSAVVDLPEPPFSLPSTTTCAEPDCPWLACTSIYRPPADIFELRAAAVKRNARSDFQIAHRRESMLRTLGSFMIERANCCGLRRQFSTHVSLGARATRLLRSTATRQGGSPCPACPKD